MNILVSPWEPRLLRGFYSSGEARDFHGISIRQAGKAKKLLRLLKLQAQIAKDAHHRDFDDELASFLKLFEAYALAVGKRRFMKSPPVWRQNTFDNTIPCECGTDWVFRYRSDIKKMYRLLEIPAVLGPFPNGGKLGGEMGFIYYLRRMTWTGRVRDLVKEFGGEETRLQRSFYWLVCWVEGRWKKLLDMPLGIVRRFPKYAEAIRVLANKHPAQPNFPAPFKVPYYIDCHNWGNYRPGSGPAHPGLGAPRQDPTGAQQQAFYNGWLRKHGVKAQVCSAPDGLDIHLFGGASCRHNDHWMRHASQVEATVAARLAALGLPNFLGYGDSIYVWSQYIRSRNNAPAGHPHKLQLDNEDKGMNSGRESIEHHFGEGSMLFPFTTTKMKIKQNMPLYEIYFNRVLLRNFYMCFYHGKTSKRFNCEPPTPEEYAAMGN